MDKPDADPDGSPFLMRLRWASRRAALVIASVAFSFALVGAAQAELIIVRVPDALGAQPSTWGRAAPPAGSWAGAAAPVTTGSPGGPASTFGVVRSQRSEFTLVGVPEAKLNATRRMLEGFGARQEPSGALTVDLPGDVLFDFDRDTLRDDARPVLDRMVALLDNFSSVPVAVNGHTDSKGDDAYNDGLSLRRADSVRRYLQTHAIASGAHRIAVQGLGERRPIAPNAFPDGRDDPAGRQKNRRVEIIIGGVPPPPIGGSHP